MKLELNRSSHRNIEIILNIIVHYKGLLLIFAFEFPINPHHTITALYYKNIIIIQIFLQPVLFIIRVATIKVDVSHKILFG